MTVYFSEVGAADRYAAFQPKVHAVALQWLDAALPGRRFDRAVDVGCGTGDSTEPLLSIASHVLGLDTSAEMLRVAVARGVSVHCADYAELPTFGHFDLISTCMAFHWFDPAIAVPAYKAASKQDAIWLLYNFAFDGDGSSDAFNHWFRETYLKAYPSPPRGGQRADGLGSDPDLQIVARDSGWLPLELSLDQLVGYLTTQSNVEHRLQHGDSLLEIQDALRRQLAQIDIGGWFKYHFEYEIVRFEGKSGSV